MSWTEKLKNAILSYRSSSYFWPIVLVSAGILLLIFFSSSANVDKTEGSEKIDTAEYVRTLEKDLEKNIKRLTSIKDCSVMITISTFEDNEYLENKNISSTLGQESEEYSREEEYLVIDDGGDDKVIIKSRNFPKICGALVVYSGSDDVMTKTKILEAVSTVLGIQSNKVCVVSNQE